MDARRLLLTMAGVGVLTAGCATAADAIRPQVAPPVVSAAPAESQRDHVYVYLVNGLDPFFFCKFNKMPDYVRSLGYTHVSIGQLPATRRFTGEIRRIHADDPLARFVLIGFSVGANNVCRMADDLKADGVRVDLLVYLGGCWVTNGPEWRPENARKIVNIRDSGLIVLTGGLLHPDRLDGAENVRIPGVTFHVDTPDSPVTQETLADELAGVAALVPAEAKPVAPAAAINAP